MGESLYDLHELNQLVIRAKIHSSSYQSIATLNYWEGGVSHTHAQPKFHKNLNLRLQVKVFFHCARPLGSPYTLIDLANRKSER